MPTTFLIATAAIRLVYMYQIDTSTLSPQATSHRICLGSCERYGYDSPNVRNMIQEAQFEKRSGLKVAGKYKRPLVLCICKGE